MNDNIEFIGYYQNLTNLLFIIGGILITSFFIAIALYCYITIFNTYWFIKKSIHFLPFKRLSEDVTTRFLLKKVIDI